ILILLFCVNLPSAEPNPQRMVVRIDNPTMALVERFTNQGADIASHRPGEYLDLVVSNDGFLALYREFPNIYITQTEAQLKTNLAGSHRDIPGYRNYQQLQAELFQLQTQYPNLVQVVSIGQSVGHGYAAQNLTNYQSFQHQLWAVKCSNNVQETEDEPAFYIVGEHHAREPISTEVSMAILINLLEGYGTNPSSTDILNTAEIWFVPLLNPDGHKIVIDQTDVWWRKNIRDNNNNFSFDFDIYGGGDDGVDLNRNYAFEWGYMSSTDDIYYPTYHGPSGFSEPETTALRNLLLSRRFLAGISYHTYGEMVLYPFGYVFDIYSPDNFEQNALAVEMAALIPKQNGGTYDPMPAWQLYPASGTSEDWIYAETGAFGFTVEMATQFIPPAAQIPQIVQNNVNGAMKLFQRKNKKMLKGNITDTLTGAPLQATVHISGIDDHPLYRVPIKSDALFGSYYYLLPAGEYLARYMRPGYLTEERYVSISELGVTTENVSLTPSEAYQLSVLIRGDFFEPLAGAALVFENLDLPTYISDADGRISIPAFFPGQYHLSVSKAGYETLHIMRNIASPDIGLRLTSIPILQETFETGISAWQRTGAWNRSTAEAYGGNYSLADSPSGSYQNDQNTYCKLINPLNLHNILNANLQFWAKTAIALDGDFVALQYSLDNQNWFVLDYFNGTSPWTLYSYDLNSFIGSNLYIRFNLRTNSSTTANGIFIDDFKLFTNADVTSVEDEFSSIDLKIASFPNPFKNRAHIRLSMEKPLTEPIEIAIYNMRGQKIRSIYQGTPSKNKILIEWDGKDSHGTKSGTGIYFVLAKSGSKTLSTSKIVMIKH
ncbi:MAG: M14 family zinc carboxypeptidase, partial [Candidatus Cloacimonadaceae bacterium]|nr:M14 family zinc carboxypeptidase [Candidatus Cloacimonadaceae bacterium]